MSKSQRKKVTVQYRKLADPVGGFRGLDLQAALVRAMKSPVSSGQGALSGEDVISRTTDLGLYGQLVLNHFEAHDELFFGEIVRFEPGAPLPLLNMGGAKEYNLSQTMAPEGHEPLRGVLYFMVFGNHVMVVENDCACGRAEKYLTWLLCQTGVVSNDAQVILEAELQTADGGNQLSSVNEIVIKPSPLEASTALLDGLTEVDSTKVTGKSVSYGRALDVLKAAGMAETDIEKITAHDTRIEVTLQVRFKSKRKKQAVLMEDAKRLLRNVSDDDLTLSGSGGRQKNGKIVKLSHAANVLLVGSLLDIPDTARALAEAYKYFAANGYIEG